ncbi:MAG: metalloregulator ArsR/SmtB family transcription factor [Gemmatimonadaceae bacterium]
MPAAALDATFSALADATRRSILLRLVDGPRAISDLASRFDMTLPAVSKHVRVLERARLARVRRKGRVRYVALAAAPMKDAAEWIGRYRAFWEHQLDLLTAYLQQEQDTTSWRKQPRTSGRSRSGAPSRRRGSGSSRRGRKPKTSAGGARRGR